MRKKIFIIAASAFMAVTILAGCDSSAKKVEEAREDVQASKENTSVADVNFRQAVQDSAAEFQKFKKESDDRIIEYEKNIAELKVKIAKEKREGKSNYQKVVADLEVKTADLKKNLKEYKENGKEDWQAFKIKFNRNMDDLGKSISNFFSSEKK